MTITATRHSATPALMSDCQSAELCRCRIEGGLQGLPILWRLQPSEQIVTLVDNRIASPGGHITLPSLAED